MERVLTLFVVDNPRKRQLIKRIALGTIIALLVHIFFLIIAPRIMLPHPPPVPTEVVQISPTDLAKLKKEILEQNKHLPPLLSQEMKEQFKSKEAPKNAKHMGQFNQVVPEETVAGAQRDAPQEGGGQNKPQAAARKQISQPPRSLQLSQLGLKYKLPKPLPAPEPREAQQATQGPRGPNQPFRPIGREDKNLKRGNENLLNAVESEYYSFFARFEDPIVRNWYFLLRQREQRLQYEMASRGVVAGAELPCTIEFTIDREGTFTRIAVVESSGIPILDESTREAVAKLGSLLNPPIGIFEGQPTFSYRLRFMVMVNTTPSLGGLKWY